MYFFCKSMISNGKVPLERLARLLQSVGISFVVVPFLLKQWFQEEKFWYFCFCFIIILWINRNLQYLCLTFCYFFIPFLVLGKGQTLIFSFQINFFEEEKNPKKHIFLNSAEKSPHVMERNSVEDFNLEKAWKRKVQRAL